jgi:hypothetical protein
MRLGMDWAASNPCILGGIPAGAIWFFALMALLSVTSISFAIQMTAASYILDTLLGSAHGTGRLETVAGDLCGCFGHRFPVALT